MLTVQPVQNFVTGPPQSQLSSSASAQWQVKLADHSIYGTKAPGPLINPSPARYIFIVQDMHVHNVNTLNTSINLITSEYIHAAIENKIKHIIKTIYLLQTQNIEPGNDLGRHWMQYLFKPHQQSSKYCY